MEKLSDIINETTELTKSTPLYKKFKKSIAKDEFKDSQEKIYNIIFNAISNAVENGAMNSDGIIKNESVKKSIALLYFNVTIALLDDVSKGEL